MKLSHTYHRGHSALLNQLKCSLPKTLSQKHPNVYIHVFIEFELATTTFSNILCPYLPHWEFQNIRIYQLDGVPPVT